jgi:mRNA interferase RelE/StbE
VPYAVVFASERVERAFEKELEKAPADYQSAIAAGIRSLSDNPRPAGKRYKKLKGRVAVSHFIAQYRLRVGPYRILYDLDTSRKKVVLLKLVRRGDHAYD